MERWRLLRYIFLVVVVALLLTSGVGAQSSCEVADSLREAKLYEDAKAAYADVLKNASLNASQRACALAGIKELQHAQAEELYNLGKTYEELNQTNDARNAYIDALKIDPNCSEAQSALARINDPFAEVRTLANNGLYTEAVDRFKKVVENNPNISVPGDLNYLVGGKISFWRWLKLQTEPWIRPIGEIFLLIAIVVLARFGIKYRICPWIKGFRNPQLDIEDFDKGATGLDIGKGVKELIEDSYKQLGESHLRLHLVDKPLKIEIPAGIKEAPYFKIVSQLIEWVFPQYVYTLSGSLQTPGNFGAGLTLKLVNSRTGEIVANHTIWQKDFDPTMTQQVASTPQATPPNPTPYYRLARLAAIWTLFQLGKQSKKFDFSSIGTQNWLSFAYLRAGVFWTLEDDKVKARQLYIEAQNQDINYRSVFFNLGYLDIEDKEYDRAIERLSHAKELSEPRKPSQLPTDDLWCLATYQLAAAYHYKSMQSKAKEDLDDAKKDLDQAETESSDLVKKIDATINEIDAKSLLSKAKKDLDQAGEEASDLVEKIDATISEPQSSMEAREERLKRFLQLLKLNAKIMQASIIADQGYIALAEKCVNSIKSECHNIFSYRVHYNFACYYSIVGNKTKVHNKTKSIDAYNQALYHLEYALERGGDIINWAQNDPSLEGIRKDKKEKEAFGKLIEKYAPEKRKKSPCRSLYTED